MTRAWGEPFEDCYELDKYGCWIWKRGHSKGGYGLKQFKGSFQGAHRVSWQIHNGPIPKGLSVLHCCDVKLCVNPQHLFLGTQKDNVRDAVKKRRTWSKLTPEDVKKIRILRKRGETLQAIGDKYGVVKQCIAYVVNRKWWRHVT